MSNMSTDMIVQIVEAVIIIISFIFGRYIVPRIPVNSKLDNVFATLNLVVGWAEKFVIMEERFSNCSGEEKMDNVVAAINTILDKHGIEMSDAEIRAIAQQSYEQIIGKYSFLNPSEPTYDGVVERFEAPIDENDLLHDNPGEPEPPANN